MKIQHLSFKFDKNQKNYFFKDISVEFAPHVVHFIQGDNGVGKSTFFNILQGATDKGSLCEVSVTLEGVSYTAQTNRLPYAFTQKVHTVQQNYDTMIANKFTFMENLQLANLPLYPSLTRLPSATVLDIVKSLDIPCNRPAYLLSGGQRQLLAILMALQKPTKLLLLDEPTATLDKNNADLIMKCLHQLATQLKVTMLIICHDRELVGRYSQGNSVTMKLLENGTREIVRD